MRHQLHCIAGRFNDPTQALATQATLGRLQTFICFSGTWLPKSIRPPQEGSNAARNDMLVDGAIGAAIGIGLGALVELAIVMANVSLFVVSPYLAPLALLGWGATLGATLGAIVGVGRKEGRLPALIRDATAKGQSVLVVQTQTEQDTSMVRAHLTATDTEVEEFMTTSNEIDAIQNKVR